MRKLQRDLKRLTDRHGWILTLPTTQGNAHYRLDHPDENVHAVFVASTPKNHDHALKNAEKDILAAMKHAPPPSEPSPVPTSKKRSEILAKHAEKEALKLAEAQVQKRTCSHCGKVCASPTGRAAHERWCDTNPDKLSGMDDYKKTTPTPVSGAKVEAKVSSEAPADLRRELRSILIQFGRDCWTAQSREPGANMFTVIESLESSIDLIVESTRKLP